MEKDTTAVSSELLTRIRSQSMMKDQTSDGVEGWQSKLGEEQSSLIYPFAGISNPSRQAFSHAC